MKTKCFSCVTVNTQTDLLSIFRKPNEPVKVDSFPDWPEFTLEDKKLMMIDYDSQLIDVPYKERMERMRSILLQSRNRRVNGDSPTPQPAGKFADSNTTSF